MVFGKESQVGRIKVMVVGLPGRAISMVAEEVSRQDDMELLGFTLGNKPERFRANGSEIVQIESRLRKQKLAEFCPDVAVDFTPRAEIMRFRDNVALYCERGIRLVAGEDRSLILRKAKVPVAIVPNVRPGSCHLIIPLVMRAIRTLSKSRGGTRAFHFTEAVAI